MPLNDLVTEIDSWIGTFDKLGIAQFVVGYDDAKALVDTLQRAREALRWIPVTKEKPSLGEVVLVQSPFFPEPIIARLGYTFTHEWLDRFHTRIITVDEQDVWRRLPAPYTPPKEAMKE